MQAVNTLFSSLILITTDVDVNKNELAEAISQMNGVTTLSFSKDMVDAIDLDIDVEDKIKHLDGDFNEIKLNIFGESTPDLASNRETILKVLNKHYKEIDLEDEDGSESDALLYTKSKGNRIYEAHLLLLNESDNTFTVISFIGDVVVTNKD